jgi:hypothetical protein
VLLRDPEVDPDQAQKSCESGTLTLHIFVSDGWPLPIPQFTGFESSAGIFENNLWGLRTK